MNRCTQLDDILTNARTLLNFKVIGQKSEVKVIFYQWTEVHRVALPNVGKIVVHNAVFRLSIA